MIIYNSMLLLVLILMLGCRTSVYECNSSYYVNTPKWVAIITMGYIVFWASLRNQFVDTATYIYSFNNAEIGFDNALKALFQDGKQKGWDFLMISFKTFISSNYHWWLSLIAVVSGFSIMRSLRKYSVNYLYSMYLFITSMIFVWMFNGIRQFIAAAIMFGLCDLIFYRKRNLFILAVLLCSTIHTTIIVMLPIYFIVNEVPFKKRMALFMLAIMVSIFAISPLLETMETVLKNTAYASNLDQFAEDDGVNPIRVLFKAIPVILAFYKRKEIEKLNNRILNVCVNMSTVSVGIYIIGMFTSGIMVGRLPIYFDLYNLILIPYLIKVLYFRNMQFLYWIISVVYLFFYYLMGRGLYYSSELTGFIK